MNRASALMVALGLATQLVACGTQTGPDTRESREIVVNVPAAATRVDLERCNDAAAKLYDGDVKEIFGAKTVSVDQLARWFDVRSDGAAPLSVYAKYEDLREGETLVVCAAVVPSVAPPGPDSDQGSPSDSVTLVLREDGRIEVDAVGPREGITTEFALLEGSTEQ